jgi:hypothetical protein
MSRTHKPSSLRHLAYYAREAHLHALQDVDFAVYVGFYLPEQEVLSDDDITVQAVKRVMEGR